MNCPICNKEITLDTAFCEQCGFEIHILPDGVSDAVMAFEQERIDRYKRLMQRKSDSETRAEELTNQLLEATKRAEAAEVRNADQTKEIQGLQKEKEELLEQIKALDIEQPIAFLVQVQGDDISAIYNIYVGDNSFGYLKSHDRHQQIICNAHVADYHFTIRAATTTDFKGRSRTKFYMAPKDGSIYRSAGQANRISSEIELDKNESVFIDDVKFTLVANKK